MTTSTDNRTIWKADPGHSVIEFAARHMMIATVKGRFTEFDVTLKGDPEDLTQGEVEVSIDVNSVDTHQPDRDAHLRSADLFDAENHPKMTFKSTEIRKVGDSEYEMTGDLTIRGNTFSETLKVEYEGSGKDPWGGTRAAFNVTGRIDRMRYGVSWNTALETGGVLVGDQIRLNISVQLVKS